MRPFLYGAVAFVLGCLSLGAQPLHRAEYFIDNYVDFGLGTPITVTQSADSLLLLPTIPTTGLAPGFHVLYVRCRNTSGKWGTTEAMEFYVNPTPLPKPAVSIQRAEYFFDQDALGVGKQTSLNIGSKTGELTLNTPIPTTGLAPGYHTLHVRTQDTLGKWGMAEPLEFYIDPVKFHPPDPKVAALEYFFDTDANGVGKMTALPSGPKAPSVDLLKSIPTTGLAPGFHILFVRSQDTAKKWGFFEEIPFWIDSKPFFAPARKIAGGEYYIDQDLLGVGKHTPLPTVSLANTLDILRNVPTSGLTPGYHSLFVRLRDSAGTWGFPEEHSFYVDPKPLQKPAPKLVAAEYFFKDDPGLGLATPISPGFLKADTINLLRTIPTVGRPLGRDTLYVRAKDSAGVWGMTEMKPFRICPNIVGTPVLSGAPSACVGGTLSLSVAPVPGATGYRWFGPGNYTATGAAITRTNFSSSMAGDYRVVAYRAGGTPCDTSNSVSFQVIMHPLPVATTTTSGNTTFCQGGNVKLRASKAVGQTYQWLSGSTPIAGATADSLVVTTSGSYSVQIASAFGCTAASSSTSITVNPAPAATASVSGSAAVCAGNTVSVQAATGPSYGYQWLLNGTPISGAVGSNYAASATGNYSVRVISGQGCEATSSAVPVTIHPLPVATASASTPAAFCPGGSSVLQASTASGQTYQWLLNGTAISGATQTSYTATAAGTYSVRVTATATGCEATSGGISVTVLPTPTATVTASGATTVCQGSSVVLNASTAAGQTYQWLNGGSALSGATGASYTATASGFYSVKITSADGCEATSSAQAVVVNPLPTAVITNGASAALCQGNPVVLQAQTAAGQTYQWLAGGIPISGATGTSYTASVTGNYSVQVTSALGCTAVSSATSVTVHPLPTASVTTGGPTTFCQGNSVVLSANTAAGQTYQWLLSGNPISGATGTSYTATASGNYSVKVTSSVGCEATSSAVPVTVNPLPAATISNGSTASFCSGSSVVLNANTGSGLTYQWFLDGLALTGATASSHTATAPGSYTVQTTNAQGCSAVSVAIAVSVNPLPNTTVTNSGSTAFCEGNTVQLTVASSAGQTQQWYLGGSPVPGATGTTLTANLAGSYTVQVIATTGCSATSSATQVVVHPLPVPSVSVPNGSVICQGGTAALNASALGATSFQWLLNGNPITGATGANFNASAPGNYAVQATSANGCVGTSSVIAVTLGTPPLAAATALGATTFCSGGSVLLLASSGTGYTYQWLLNGSPVSGATSTTYTATATGSYTVQITSSDGCIATSNGIVVVVNAAPQAVVTPLGSTSFCPGGSVQLVASFAAGNTYQWLQNGVPLAGATLAGLTASAAGAYTVLVTNSNGCSAPSAPVVVSWLAKPTASISASTATIFCQGSSVQLNASPASGHTYQWVNSGAPIPGATSGSYLATASGAYSVWVTSSATGCSDTAGALSVTAEPNPTVIAAANTDTAFCPGGSVLLSASGTSGLTYQWFRNGTALAGATGAVYTATQAGTYTVRGTSAIGCTNVSNPRTVVALPGVTTSMILGSTGQSGQASKPIRFQPYPYTVSQNLGHTYAWVATNGAILSGQGTNSVSVIWNDVPTGTLTVVETDGSCVDTASISVFISMTSLDESSTARSVVYPNPSDGPMQLRAAWPAGHAEWVNSLGQTVQRSEFTEGAARWDATQWPKGVYQLVLTGPNDEREVLRVVLQ